MKRKFLKRKFLKGTLKMKEMKKLEDIPIAMS